MTGTAATEAGRIIGLVVDPDYGERLHSLAARMPVWIVDSPVNGAAWRAWWSAHPESRPETGVALFGSAAGATPEEVVVATLVQIDMQYAPDTLEFPFAIVSVFGAKVSPSIQEALREYGLTELCDTPDGFVATKPA